MPFCVQDALTDYVFLSFCLKSDLSNSDLFLIHMQLINMYLKIF